MRRGWIGLAVITLCSVAATDVHGGSTGTERPAPLSLKSIASTYPTPNALAQFLRHTMRFKTDEQLFGEQDYWQTPEEFLARRAGDCEDYALFVQAVLRAQGIEADVLSVYGLDGYAHTVCVFVESGRYSVINTDRVQHYRANTLEAVASHLHPGWTHAAIARHAGTRGRLVRLLQNPTPSPAFPASESLISFL